MDVDAELSKLSLKPGMGSKKSFAKLQEMLGNGPEGEVPIAGARGLLRRNQEHAPEAQGSYAVVTSHRVLLAAQGMVFTGGFEAPVHEVVECEMDGRGMSWYLHLRTLQWDYIFKSGSETAIRALEGAIVRQQRLYQSGALTDAVAAAAPKEQGNDLAAQLEKLGNLHAAGVLSEEEFLSAKQRLLGG